MTFTTRTDTVAGMSNFPYIPEADLATIVRGSQQEVLRKITRELGENLSRFGGQPVTVMASFDESVVVLTDSNDVVRVGYELDSAGRVHLTRQEVLPITVVTEQNASRYLRQKALEAADLFLKGYAEAANRIVASLAPVAEAHQGVPASDIVTGYTQSLSESAWREVFAKTSDSMRSILSEETLPDPLAPKFRKLYDGSTEKAELPAFEGLVRADTDHLIARLATVEASVVDAIHRLALKGEKTEADGAAVEFAESLLSDVRRMMGLVSEAAEDFAVDEIARVFDAMATEVASFEVASAFVAKTALRLAESGR